MEDQKALKTLNPKSVFIPIIIAIGAVVYMFWQDDQLTNESLAYVFEMSGFALLAALLVLGLKDGLNSLRISSMSHGELNLKSALYIVLLWEFTVAVAPPLLGATTVLVFIFFKEGLSFGKAIAYALLVASLDNLFFITSSPFVIWFSGGEVFPDVSLIEGEPNTKISYLFWLSYAMIIGYTSFMLSAVVVMPKFINKVLISITDFKLLKRFKEPILQQGKELLMASKILRGQKISYWLKLLGITYSIWLCKYLVLAVVANGFVPLNLQDYGLVVQKHLVMWVALLVSPSPGNAGTAEFIFPAFFQEILGESTFASSLIWRSITYDPYLILGAIILPNWLKKR